MNQIYTNGIITNHKPFKKESNLEWLTIALAVVVAIAFIIQLNKVW